MPANTYACICIPVQLCLCTDIQALPIHVPGLGYAFSPRLCTIAQFGACILSDAELSWTALWPRRAPRPGQQPAHRVCVQDQWQAHLAARASPEHLEAPGQAREPQLPKAKAALVAAEANQAVGGEPSDTNPSRLAADQISADLDRAQSRPQVPFLVQQQASLGAQCHACSFVRALALQRAN